MSAGKSAQKRSYKLSGGTDMEKIRENPHWTFNHTMITPEDVSLIASLIPNTVTTLSLYNCGITIISPLKDSMPNVQTLDLGKNKIEDISPLHDSMPNVQELDLGWNQIVGKEEFKSHWKLLGKKESRLYMEPFGL